MASDLFSFPMFKCTVRPPKFNHKAPQKQQKEINKSTKSPKDRKKKTTLRRIS